MPNPTSFARPSRDADIPAIAHIAEETLFPGDMLAPMIAPFLDGTGEALWLTAEADGIAKGFAFAEPEAMTDATWNLRAIAVDPASHRSGAGRSLLAQLEALLKDRGARLLVIDTTQTEDQTAARAFYAGLGYAQVARIPNFFADGEDKVSFIKRLR